jgi:hypothetical protein
MEEKRAVFESNSFVTDCFAGGIESVFAAPPMAALVNQVFWSSEALGMFEGCYKKARRALHLETTAINGDSEIYSALLNPRSCPAILFLMEGVSKAVLLALVAHVTSISAHAPKLGALSMEIQPVAVGALIVMMLLMLIYEVSKVTAKVRYDRSS